MRELGLAAICAALVLLTAPAHAQAPAPLDRDRVATFIDGAVAALMDSRHVAGVTVAVVDREGVVLARGYGQAGENRAVDADTLFRVGSISKTPTWLAIMQLVDDGKLTLDDPINDHLPEALRVPDEGFDEPIRIRHLMTHTPGFEDSALGHLFVPGPDRVLNMQDYLARYRVHRVRPAGSLAVYSNYGANLAGAIVAHETGGDFATYAETRIFRPLGMTSTTYREPYPAAIAAANSLPAPIAPDLALRISEGYRYLNGAYEAQPFEYVTHMAAAGSMSSSANDMARYMAALLSPEQMAAVQVLRSETAAGLTQPMHANFEGWGEWRHGFMSMDLGGGRWAYGHGGDTLFQHSAMLVSPELGFGIFVSTNTETGPLLEFPMIYAFVRAFFPESNTPAHAAAVTQAESARYAGTYRGFRRPYYRTERALFSLIGAAPITTAENGDLIIPGPEPERMEPLGDGVYRSTSGPNRVAFREVEGRMRMYDSAGLAPMERIGFLQSPEWLGLIAGLGAIVALWGVIAGARRIFARKETRAALIFDGLCLIWLVAGVLMAAALLPWTDQSTVLFGYPGPLFPIACWMLAVAAIATPVALSLALLVWRPTDWLWPRWARAGAAVAVFATLSISLWDWGLLGYSGF
jgi:CubicO group peptidase (beta-lactamase class C family)